MSREQLEAKVLGSRYVANNVIVANCLSYWLAGQCSLDESMLWSVLHLCEQNAKLLEMLTDVDIRRPTVIHVHGTDGGSHPE